MSRGPGQVERAVADLFAANPDRAFTVAGLCAHAFGLGATPPTRAQRISALRAAHRVLQRADEPDDTKRRILRAMMSKLGARALRWRIHERDDGRLVFHEERNPQELWAVQITREGVLWAAATIRSVTRSRISAEYRGERISLHRESFAWPGWAWWRGIAFTGERNGFAAREFDRRWHARYGAQLVGSAPMSLAVAVAVLKVPENYTRTDVIVAFRRAAHQCHPDKGGTVEQWLQLVAARDRLLAAIGTSAAAPKMPAFPPKGVKVRYGVTAPQRRRLSGTRRLSAALT